MNERTMVRSSVSGRTISLVPGEVTFIRIFARDYPQRTNRPSVDFNFFAMNSWELYTQGYKNNIIN